MMGKRQNTLEDLIDIASLMPWWLGVTFAAGSYLAIDFAAPLTGNKFGETLLGILKYFLAIGFSCGAIISAVKQWKKGELYKRQTGIETIRQLSWYAFELMISEAFGRQGYKVRETEYGPDGGVDLILNKDNKTLFVQCKHWKVWKVGVKQIRELQGVISVRGADGGIFVTSGKYSIDAINFAKKCNIQLIDGNDLHAMFNDIPFPVSDQTVNAGTDDPDCPSCGSLMVKRIAKKGARKGKEFWGCSTFPKCRGTLDITN